MVGIEYTMEDYERWRRYGLANKAMERILIMYHELAEVKGGAQKGKLRAGPVAMPEDFVLIDCSADWFLTGTGSAPPDIDIKLLREGSAVSILCMLTFYYRGFLHDENCRCPGDEFLPCRAEDLLKSGRMQFLPTAAEAVRAFLYDDKNFGKRCADVYSEYVVGYFKKIVSGEWWKSNMSPDSV